MATYNIKLYAHGVPNGQSIWGKLDTDAQYIETFYGRKSSVPSQMLVEVMQFDGKTNSYYTYFRHGNFQDNGGRPGGYFALTLRINHYYRDIQNIYNLLEAAFNKFIIGSVLEQTNDGYRFLISQLNQKDELFKDLENELEHYLMQFSDDKDFIPLGGFKSNGQNECGTINLLEATPSVVIQRVKSTGKISVSPLHPSSKEQQIINECQNKLRTIQNDAKQQIATIKQKAQDDIATIQSSTKREAQTTIAEYQAYKTKYENAQAELDKANKVIIDIKRGLDISLRNVQFPYHNDDDTPKRSSGFMNVVKKLHPFIDFFLMLLLIGMVSITSVSKSCHSGEMPDTSPHSDTTTVTSPKQELEVKEEQEDSLKYTNAKIDIAEIDKNTPMRVGKTYTVSLKGVLDELATGTWKADSFTISGNSITPKYSGKCTIKYVVNNKVVKSRLLDVKR